jgi:hypothetical protein
MGANNHILEILEGETSPYIFADQNKKRLTIKGQSFMNNSKFFFGPLINWVNQFTMTEKDVLTIEITTGYYNTASIYIINTTIKSLNARFPQQIKLILRIEREEGDDYEETASSITFGTGVTPIFEYF